MNEERQDLLGVIEPPEGVVPFTEWQTQAYREFAERHADILFAIPEESPGKPCKPIPCPIGEDEF